MLELDRELDINDIREEVEQDLQAIQRLQDRYPDHRIILIPATNHPQNSAQSHAKETAQPAKTTEPRKPGPSPAGTPTNTTSAPPKPESNSAKSTEITPPPTNKSPKNTKHLETLETERAQE